MIADPAPVTIPSPRPPAGDRITPPALVEQPPSRPVWHMAVLAVGLYIGLRLISLAIAWHFAVEQHRDLWKQLARYDAGWYATIAARGYDTVIPLKANGSLGTSNLAFFPLYPGLTALLDPILPGGTATAGIMVSWLAGVAAAAGLFAVGAQVRDRATGVLLAALWAVIPHALVESMGYSETLFTALSAWSLFFLLRRQWVTAGLFCLFAGLTRPTAAALIGVVGLSALIAVIQRRDGWRPWVGGALAPLGMLGFLAWVGHRLHRADGYLHVQNDSWRMGYDTGHYTLKTAHDLLLKAEPLAFYVVTLVLLLAVSLTIVLAGSRMPWQLTVYAAVMVAMAFFGDSYYNSKARMLVPAFTLLLPAAAALARSRRHVAVAVLGVMTLISAGYGVYLSLLWNTSP